MRTATDVELVIAARSGDQAAFAALYDRYADRVFALCVSLTRDRGVAEDALSETFLLAWQRLGQLREPGRVRPWLFAIARNRVTRLGTRAARSEPVDPMGGDFDAVAAAGGDVAADVAAGVDASVDVALVWEAAAGLNEAERAALELSVRQGLEGDELAAALGMTRHHANVTVGRMRQNLERSVGALRLLRSDDAACPTLEALVDGYRGELTPLWRKRIARHADGCAVCDDRRRAPRAIANYGATPAGAAPAGVRARVLDALPVTADGLPQVDRSAFRADRDGFPSIGRRFRSAGVVAVVLVVVLVVVAAFPSVVGDGRTAPGEPDATELAAGVAATSVADGATADAAVGSPSAGDAAVPTGSATTSTPTATTPATTLAGGSGSAGSAAGSASSTTRPDTLPPKILSVSSSPNRIRATSTGCPVTSVPTTATLTVGVSDNVGVVAGDVEVSLDGTTWRSLAVTAQPGRLVGTLGTVKYAGSVRVRVNAVTDAAGNRSAPWGTVLQVKVEC